MPLRYYQPVKPGRCRYCSDGFEQHQSPSAAALKECPRCGAPVLLQESNPLNVAGRWTRKPSPKEASDAGFTVMQRTQDGHYVPIAKPKGQ